MNLKNINNTMFVLVFTLLLTGCPEPIVHYEFDDSSNLGLDTNDRLPRIDGVNKGVNSSQGVTQVAGVKGGAASFNGSEYFELIDPQAATNPRFNFANSPFTITFWFYNLKDRTANDTRNQTIWASPSSTGSNYFAIFADLRTEDVRPTQPGEIFAKINAGRTSQGEGVPTTHASFGDPKEIETWHHYAVVRGNTKMITYVDGVEVNSIPLNDEAIYIFEPTQPARIGVFGDATASDFPGNVSDEFLNGWLDDFRIYDQSLNANQIRNIFEDGGFDVINQMPIE